MDPIIPVLKRHADRYPAMTVQDHVKLLYQATFGPRHFAEGPTLDEVRRYLHRELAETPADPMRAIVEDIGGGYARVPLECVHAGMISTDALAEAFHRSMRRPLDGEAARQAFTERLATLAGLIRAGALGLPADVGLKDLSEYLAGGIRPIHHSPAYNQKYHPHYRVIHENDLPEGVRKMEIKVYVKTTRFKGIEANPSLLGFGCMRLPTLEKDKPDIDVARAEKMIDEAYARGVTYFDTAYPYHHGLSELFIGQALKKYPRESFYLASKMPGWLVHSRTDAEKYFNEQLAKCQVEYFDYYLCHALGEENYKPYLIPGVMEFLREMKTAGKIRHLGFSFHDVPDVLDRIIHAHEWDFVQLQLNYLDWEFQDARRQYDIVTGYGVPVIVMEPVRGGLLATLSEEAVSILKAAEPEKSVASWAIRYAASKSNVMVVLSGMSNEEQVSDNLATMAAFRPLEAKDEDVLHRALEAFLKNRTIPCTACRYCMPCPNGVDIPRIFRVHNEFALHRHKRGFVADYEEISPEHRAEACIWCGECLTHCPQKIMIPERLAEIAALYKGIKKEGGMGMQIVNCYREKMPPSRFIGRKYGDQDRDTHGGFGNKWGEWFADGLFAPLERLAIDTPEGGSYIGLMRCVPQFQYWIGVFCPAGTPVPEGYHGIDFPAMDLSVSWVKGKQENGEVYGAKVHDASVAAGRAIGLEQVKEPWYFERYCEPRFCHPDAAGDIILDYCIEIKTASAK